MHEALRRAMDALPLIAILRGLEPDEALDVAHALVGSGFRLIEVPLNSPAPFQSIERLAGAFGEEILIGAGTVLDLESVARLQDAGGRLVVMPHGDPAVIAAAKAHGMACTPGVATPTEGFAALRAGADALKLFPAESLGPDTLKAWRAVFPKSVAFLPVGGITPETIAPWRTAGAAGFGLGSALFKPGMPAMEVGRRADGFAAAWRGAQAAGS